MRGAIKKLSVKGFKSIRELKDFELKDLNIIIGANGVGKSNLVQVFRMLMAMSQKNLQKFILERGGADNFLYNGPKITPSINVKFEFQSHSMHSEGSNYYSFELTPNPDERFVINESSEYDLISNWMVYHFHDTSLTAPMRRSEIVEDNHKLRHDASNIAPFLLHLKNDPNWRKNYQEIVDAVRFVIPFFDDFRLEVQQLGEAQKVKLSWQQKGSDFPMQPYHLSDGSIRFICLATALLQPDPPSTLIIDEPELGLHPEAISILAELIQDAAQRTQLIIATQSPSLLNEFAVKDIVVVNRKGGQSTFERLSRDDYSSWLESYSVGELWTKNVIPGGTTHLTREPLCK